ncbi:MAG: hypothetical protein DMG58_08385 [Acidobacteria bacterium]|nr:MAG: hypothetical protein DMG58_08385 [Acidobacteriota bacterium]
MHGYGIASLIQQVSDEVLRLEEGSLYPALHRLELDGIIARICPFTTCELWKTASHTAT